MPFGTRYKSVNLSYYYPKQTVVFFSLDYFLFLTRHFFFFLWYVYSIWKFSGLGVESERQLQPAPPLWQCRAFNLLCPSGNSWTSHLSLETALVLCFSLWAASQGISLSSFHCFENGSILSKWDLGGCYFSIRCSFLACHLLGDWGQVMLSSSALAIFRLNETTLRTPPPPIFWKILLINIY